MTRMGDMLSFPFTASKSLYSHYCSKSPQKVATSLLGLPDSIGLLLRMRANDPSSPKSRLSAPSILGTSRLFRYLERCSAHNREWETSKKSCECFKYLNALNAAKKWTPRQKPTCEECTQHSGESPSL